MKTKCKIGDLGQVVTGKTPSTSKREYYGHEYPFITPSDITGSFHVTPATYLSSEGARLLNKIMIPAKSVCYTCIASIGKICVTKEDSFTNQQINSIIVDEEKNDFRYVYYLLKFYTNHIKAIATGAATPIVNKERFSNVEVSVHKLDKQKRIADILSAYDDLIENNQKQIKLLEEAAMRLYKEWFVKLRFPGHEKTKIVDGVPEGWRLGRVSELAEFKRGKTITKKNAKDGNVPVVAGGLEPAYFHNVANTVAPVITISASGANAGYTRLYNTDIWASDCSYIDASYGDKLYFIYTFLKNNKEVIDNLQRGAAQPHVYAKDINALSTYIPESTIMEPFCNLVAPLFKKIAVQERLISELKQARDKLLPKLMNGEIEV
jgi:type I restriction enzyme S subunit